MADLVRGGRWQRGAGMEAGLPPPASPLHLPPAGLRPCRPCWQVGKGLALPEPPRAVRRRGRGGRKAGCSPATRGRGSDSLASLPGPPCPASCRRPAGKWPAPEWLCVLAQVSSAGHQKVSQRHEPQGPRLESSRQRSQGTVRQRGPGRRRACRPLPARPCPELPGKSPVFFTDHQPQEPHRSGPEAVSSPACPLLCAGHAAPPGLRRFQQVPWAAALDRAVTRLTGGRGNRVSGPRPPGPAASSRPSSSQSPGGGRLGTRAFPGHHPSGLAKPEGLPGAPAERCLKGDLRL